MSDPIPSLAIEPAHAATQRARGGQLLQNWKDAYDRALVYLSALGVGEAEREGLALDAVEQASGQVRTPALDGIAATLAVLRARLAGDRDGFLRWRLEHAGGPAFEAPAAGQDAVRSTPALRRRSMEHEPLKRHLLHRPGSTRSETARPRAASALFGNPPRTVRRSLPWTRVARRRRALLLLLVLVPTVLASAFMQEVLPHQGRTWLELSIVVVFGVLFGWVSVGFWTALLGFAVLARGRDRFAITGLATGEVSVPHQREAGVDPAVPTAIVMPIANEPVDRVFAGLRVIERSLARLGAADRFHFFVLSDSDDPDVAAREEMAWFAWCREVGGFGRIFYRRRRVRIERKSGNVADFCRRWGARYRYMIPLDADSIMAGETLLRLVELMETHPYVGMIQTAATAVNRRSLFARVQQFASHVYVPIFAAGLNWWQLGDGQYWGHNTIIRVAPFMAHCGLPRLPGQEPMGGEILSHDFVEAALMGRAGWSIWLAYDLGGSWEEIPATLLEEMKRDRRWCQGNLQHLRLIFTEGLFGAHRAIFLNGVFSYLSAALWSTFLALSTIEAVDQVLRRPDYFPNGPSLFPQWPVWHPDWALSLVAVIGVLLFLPKALSVLLISAKWRQSRSYGGAGRLTLSVLLEIVFSSLLAPIRMAFHSRFVLSNLLGRTVSWSAQGREDTETGWREALRRHGLDSLVASAWGAALYWLNPDYFWWITPIIAALILSVPVSVIAARVRLGELCRRWGLFLIPEESDPPAELRELGSLLQAAQPPGVVPAAERAGFVHVVVDPYGNAVHRALLRGHRQLAPPVRSERRALVERALREGPAALTPAERRVLLLDPEAMDELHESVWAIPERERAARWGRPGAAVSAVA